MEWSAWSWPAWLANTATVLITLQFNYLGNRYLTWRSRLAGTGGRAWLRWWRFHCARGASAVLSIGLFPALAPKLGPSLAYWVLLAIGAALNFCTDRYWSFAHRTRPAARLACLGG